MLSAIRSGISLPIYNAMINGAPLAMLPNSTLNQKLNILPDVNDGPFAYPVIDYYAIGAGDAEPYIGASGAMTIRQKQHESTDAAPFRQRPFVLRKLNQDLTPEERKNFRLRNIITVGSDQYWAYWLRKLSPATLPPTHDYITIDQNNRRSEPLVWNPSTAAFDPVGRTLSTTGVNVINKELITSTVPREITWGEFERNEYLNVARILYNDEAEAIIGDIAIVAGRERKISAPTGNGGASVMIDECILATVMAWISKSYDAYRGGTFEATFKSSIEEPVFASGVIPLK
jgi:hypothetical protein